jgi:hypothetical protein
VTFIEDRGGRAIVRLPNGSKTTVDYGALQPTAGSVHFAYESAYCQEEDCEWRVENAPTRTEAEDQYLAHHRSAHGEGP